MDLLGAGGGPVIRDIHSAWYLLSPFSFFLLLIRHIPCCPGFSVFFITTLFLREKEARRRLATWLSFSVMVGLASCA